MGACLATLAGASTALGGSGDVLADYQDDGHVSAGHSIADLQAALALAEATEDADGFREALERALDEGLLGIRSDSPAPVPPEPQSPPPAPAPRSAPEPSEEPSLALTPEALAAERSVTERAGEVAGLSAVRELPQPPEVAPEGEIPTVFLVLTGAATALLLAGAGSAAYRRVARSRRVALADRAASE